MCDLSQTIRARIQNFTEQQRIGFGLICSHRAVSWYEISTTDISQELFKLLRHLWDFANLRSRIELTSIQERLNILVPEEFEIPNPNINDLAAGTCAIAACDMVSEPSIENTMLVFEISLHCVFNSEYRSIYGNVPEHLSARELAERNERISGREAVINFEAFINRVLDNISNEINLFNVVAKYLA